MNYRRPHPAADPDFDARNAEVEPDSRLQDGFIKVSYLRESQIGRIK